MKMLTTIIMVLIGINVFADSKSVYNTIQTDYKKFYSIDS